MKTLLTDFYQLTMSYGYFRAGMANHEAVFHLFFRQNPFHSGYTIAAGLDNAIQMIKNFHFDASDLKYLKSLKTSQKKPLFDHDFLNYLKNLKLNIDVDAVPEGSVVFPHEPLIRVKGPLIHCQLLETALLNAINFPTLVATKASRICFAAQGSPVIEFGLRRAQGFDGGLTASRAAYIGGCAGTSNVLAGKYYHIPLKGTHAHSWIMSFENEVSAFETFSKTMTDNSYFLVDTYDTLQGVKNAIKFGHKLKGIRLDSGDLAYLSIKSRKMLDKAGLKHVKIMASNDLDEYIIASLKQQKAKIDVWGVGTKLATAYEQPALEGVYKLSAIRAPNSEWEYKLKLSEQTIKISTPGLLRTRRYFNHQGVPIGDCIYDEKLGIADIGKVSMIDILDPTRFKKIHSEDNYRELLQAIFKKGRCVYKSPDIHHIRQYAINELNKFHPGIRRFLNPHAYPVGLEKNLYDLRFALILKARKKT